MIAENSLSSVKGKKKAVEHEGSGDETDEKTKFLSKRRVKNTPKKDAHRKHSSNGRNTNIGDEDSGDGDNGDGDNGDGVCSDTEPKNRNRKTVPSKNSFDDVTIERKENHREVSDEEKEKSDLEKFSQDGEEKRSKKELDLSREAAQLEKEVDALISGKARKKKPKPEGDEEENEKKFSRRKGTPKKVEKGDGSRKKGNLCI